MLLRHAFDRQRDVVITGPLAVARTRNRILARVMRAAVGGRARRQNADRLAFQHRKRHRPEIEHDVMNVAIGRAIGEPVVADHRRASRLLVRVEIHVRLCGRPRRHDRAAHGIHFDAARLGRRIARCARARRFVRGGHGHRVLFRQDVPRELLFDRIRIGLQHRAPVVDRAGRTRRHACHAAVADLRLDDVVVVVVRDRIDRASLFARVAANADFRIDQMLPENFDRYWAVHDFLHL